ncbi:MAG: tRNA pseudouridine(38-40) synthase TruA [Cellulosilyticaceae bacterium]
MRNFKLVIQFDGSRYKGWQNSKEEGATVQSKIQMVLSKLTEEKIDLIGCCRVDTGVHAENYIANFKTDSSFSAEMMLHYLYEYLPDDIVVKSLEEVDERFHARYNVKGVTYTYKINNNAFRDVFNRKYVYHLEDKLDIEAMKKASEVLVGKHDFQSFTSLRPDGKSTVKTLNYIEIIEEAGMIYIEMNANEFLWNMPRLILGILLEVGRGDAALSKVEKVLEEQAKREHAPMAQPKGLYVKEVQY